MENLNLFNKEGFIFIQKSSSAINTESILFDKQYSNTALCLFVQEYCLKSSVKASNLCNPEILKSLVCLSINSFLSNDDARLI